MGKSEEMLRLERELNEQPELKEKMDAEIRRIAEAGEAESDGEAMVKAAAALGYTITPGELERAAADLEKLDDDELDAAGGGIFDGCDSVFVCDEGYFFDGKPPERTKPIRTNPIRTNPIRTSPSVKKTKR